MILVDLKVHTPPHTLSPVYLLKGSAPVVVRRMLKQRLSSFPPPVKNGMTLRPEFTLLAGGEEKKVPYGCSRDDLKDVYVWLATKDDRR